MKKIFSILLVAMFALGMVSCSNNPKSVVKNFEKACISGDFDKAATFLNMDEDQQKMVSGMMSSMYKKEIEKNPELAVEDFKILEVNEDGDKATVKVEEIRKNGETKTEEYKLVKVDGYWKLDAGK